MPSRSFNTTFKPTQGWSTADPLDSPPGSMTSGKNLWVEAGALIPRSRLTLTGQPTPLTSNNTSAAWAVRVFVSTPSNSGTIQDLYVIAGSATTFRLWYMDDTNTREGGGGFTEVSHLTTHIAPNARAFIKSADVWSDSDAENHVVFCDGSSASLYVVRPSGVSVYDDFVNNGGGYITPRTVAAFDNSPVVWGASAGGELHNAVIWPTGGDPRDWQNIGAGFEHLVDSHGEPSRIFALEDEMVLATTRQLWRGRKIGGPFRFQFTLLDGEIGMPFREAAIQTPFGLFWLNDDYMVYHYNGGAITAVGWPIRDTLREDLYIEARGRENGYIGSGHMMSYDPERRAITLHYSTNPSSTQVYTGTAPANVLGQGPNAGFTFFPEQNIWLPQDFSSMGDDVRLIDTAPGVWDMNTATGSFQGLAKRFTTYFATSRGSIMQYSSTASRDNNTAVVEAEYVSGALWGGDLQRRWLCNEVRLGVRGAVSSNISVSVSGDLGTTYGAETQRSLPISSVMSQIRVPMLVSGDQHVVRLRSEDTGWKLSRVYARAKDIGENL